MMPEPAERCAKTCDGAVAAISARFRDPLPAKGALASLAFNAREFLRSPSLIPGGEAPTIYDVVGARRPEKAPAVGADGISGR
jgi:hypothetical protein